MNKMTSAELHPHDVTEQASNGAAVSLHQHEMTIHISSTRRFKLGKALLFALCLGISSMAYAQDDTAARESTEFQAADLSKHKEDLSGIPFMVGAYMIIWSGLFVYLHSIQKRTNHIGSQLTELQAALQAHDDAQRDEA